MRMRHGISVTPLLFYVHERISMSPRIKVLTKSYISGIIHDQI